PRPRWRWRCVVVGVVAPVIPAAAPSGVVVVVVGVVVVVWVVAAVVVPAGSSAPCEPMGAIASVPPASSAPVRAAMRRRRRMSVVAPAVAAAAARALDERGDPRAVRAVDVGLDAGHAGAQAGEAADALEAGVAGDLDGHGAALGVAQPEGPGAAVDGHDRALVLPRRGLGGRGLLRGGLGGSGDCGSRAERGQCGGDGDGLPHPHVDLLGAWSVCEIRMRSGPPTAV